MFRQCNVYIIFVSFLFFEYEIMLMLAIIFYRKDLAHSDD